MFQTITQRLAARRAARTLGLPRAASAPLISGAIFLLALAPRALALGRFTTVDEAYHWFERARQFLAAIRAGDWSATNLIGHPGVTTMWLGALGVATHQALAAWGLATWPDPELLRVMFRLPVAVVTSLCIALGYLLLRRLLPTRVALLAALLWAADPFLVAHSQLLHVDALLTSFITLTLLAALLAFGLDAAAGPVRWPPLIASAVAGGLALLTKSPAIVLPPMVGLIALVAGWRQDKGRRAEDEGRARQPGRRFPAFVFRLSSFVIPPLLAWVGIATMVWLALWPAAWIDPLGAVGSVIHQVQADGGSPHGWGNFFMGRAVADPGPLFYPVAVALRLTPWALAGLVAAMIGAILALRRSPRRMNLALILLTIFVVLFSTMMSIAAKKFDRYALPIFPALDVIAAAGLVWLWDRLHYLRTKNKGLPLSAAKGQRTHRRAGSFVICSLFFVLIASNLAWYHPYELAYYNPLLGGGPAAAQLMPVGWGEGLEQAGAFITAQPDGAERPVATWYRPALKPYISAPLVPLGAVLEPGKVGYAVLYIDQVQRRDDAAATDLLRSQLAPLYIVRIHGIDYAEVYQVPQPTSRPLEADFGPALHLRGYDLDASNTAQGSLGLTVHWQARASITGDYMLFVHVLDSNGVRVGGTDVPPGGAREPTSAWRVGSYLSAPLQVPVQPNLPAGTYWIAIGLYDPRSGARLDLRAAPQPQAPSDGPNALLLEPFQIGR
jgi:Dolichyl-phosphate-mannose-protein mannosyltransferase